MEEKKERVMTDEKTREKIREYAEEKGLKIPRAYRVLLEKGLEVVKN